MTNRGGRFSDRPWLRAWLVTALAGWATLGVLLVTRANNFGLIDDISISPFHVVGYAALLTLAAYVAWTFFRALRHGRWRQAFPPLYGGLGLGFVLLLAWVILDPIWRDTLGIRLGIEGGLAPTRLLIPAGLALLAVGPLREAIALRAERGLRPGEHAIRWAGVVAAGLVGSAVTLAAFNPITTPTNDWSYGPAVDNSEIWTMAADGSAQTRLLAALGDGVDYSLPAWSPDGTRIAYTVWTNEGGAVQNLRAGDQSSSIWTMAADGSDRQLLVDGGQDQAWIPAWSPDGQWLTYTVTPLGANPTEAPRPESNLAPGQAGPPGAARGAAIWIVRADGTGAHRLSPEGIDAVGATWSPDGSSIAFIAAVAGGESDITVAEIDQATMSAYVGVARDPGNDWAPAWSPDGTRIVFTSNRTGNDEIWSVEVGAPEAAPSQLTDELGGDWVPAYSPDGSRIAFVSDRTGEPEIWTMATDGSDLKNLTNHPQHFDGNWSVSWSPDGSTLAYGTASVQDPVNSSWVREDFAAAQALLFGLAVSIVALLIVAVGAPLGAFTVALLLMAAAAAIPVDGWRFLPGALLAGLATDGLVSAVRPRWKARAAASTFPAAATLAIGATIGIVGTLAWSVTLLLGVAVASGVLGWALAEAVERLLPRSGGAEPAPIEG